MKAQRSTKSKKSVAGHARTTARRGKKANWRTRGQQQIDSQRVRDIQQALIDRHYMSGAATGSWDDNSRQAMEKFQADNGWQKKVIPDSRALIMLGLGPNQAHLLNPESAMTMAPAATPGVQPASENIPAVNSTAASPR